MKIVKIGLVICLIAGWSSRNQVQVEPVKTHQKTVYQNDWTSLRKHEAPQWPLDAKFGIYCH